MSGSISSSVTLIWTAFGSSQTVLGRVSDFVDKSLAPASSLVCHLALSTLDVNQVRVPSNRWQLYGSGLEETGKQRRWQRWVTTDERSSPVRVGLPLMSHRSWHGWGTPTRYPQQLPSGDFLPRATSCRPSCDWHDQLAVRRVWGRKAEIRLQNLKVSSIIHAARLREAAA